MTSVIAEDALLCDEAGLWFVRFGDRIFCPVAQPIFRMARGHGSATHVAVATTSKDFGSVGGFADDLPMSVIEATCRVANLRNCDLIDGALPAIINLDLNTTPDDRSLISQFRIMAEERSLLKKPRPLLCCLSGTDALPVERLMAIAGLARDHGIGIALFERNAGFPAVETVLSMQPDLLQITAEWLTRVTAAPPAARFLKPLFRSLRQSGTRIVVEGVATKQQALAVLAADPDGVAGDFFSPTRPVGAVLDLAIDRSAELTAASDEKVIDLSLRRLHRAR